MLDGKYGPYIQHGTQRISLPKEISIPSLTMQQALGLLGTSIKKQNDQKMNIVKNISAAVTKSKKSKKSSYVQ